MKLKITYNGHVFKPVAKEDQVPDKLTQLKPIKNLYHGDINQVDHDLTEIWRETFRFLDGEDRLPGH